jgi:branched-chain amino acid transport system ATP-binding protein
MPISGEPVLSVRALRAGYGGRMIVDGVDLDIAPGEVVTVIGQNGAGKSTLLKGIAHLLQTRSGETLLAGEPVFHLSTQELLQRGLAFIPQGRSVFPGLTVAENLRMGGYLLRDQALLRSRIDAQLDAFPALQKVRGQLAANLSGGQQRQLELARTMVMEPRVIMLDEPSIGLAPRVVDQVFTTLRHLAESGRAVLMVEQNVRRALQASDRGVVLELGRARLQDSAAALLADERVARLYMGRR